MPLSNGRKEKPPATKSPRVIYSRLDDDALERRWNGEGDAAARDILLLRKWKAGDQDAARTLLESYKDFCDKAFRKAGLGNEADRLDAFQELAMSLFKNRKRLPDRVHTSFAGYLGLKAREAVRRVRRNLREHDSRMRARLKKAIDEGRIGKALADGGTPVVLSLEGEEPSTEDRLELRAIFGEAIAHCAGSLAAGQRQVFEMLHVQQLSVNETAGLLDKEPNAVHQTCHRMVESLAECFRRFLGVDLRRKRKKAAGDEAGDGGPEFESGS